MKKLTYITRVGWHVRLLSASSDSQTFQTTASPQKLKFPVDTHLSSSCLFENAMHFTI